MKNLTQFFNYAANTPQNTGGGNSHFFMRLCKSTALLLLALTLGVGNAWGQTLIEIDDMETTSGSGSSLTVSGWSKGDCTISQSSEARTGSYSIKTDYNGTGDKTIKTTNTSISVPKSSYLHCIGYAKFESSDATSSSSSNQAAANSYIGGNGKGTYVNLSTSWAQFTSSKQASSASSSAYVLLQRKHSGKKAVLFDDVVIYVSTNSTTDVTAPTAASSASATTSSISWTCGSDANTGIANTLIWRRSSGSSNDLTLNNQGKYVVPATGSTLDQSGHWTLVNAEVAANATSYSGSFTGGDVYAIVHRDLAYNYSSPTYVTIPGGAPVVDVTPPTLSSSSPADEATSVALSGDIVLTMSENVSVADASKFALTGGAGSLTTASISASGTAIIIPYTDLANSTEYTLTAAAGAIQDGADTPNSNEAFSISFTTICLSPSIVWGTQPAGGEVGDADVVATVTTTPGEQTITWTSSRTAVATVTNGTIHYVAPGFTNISAEFTYSGSDYCEEKASINKDIVVPITTTATGANDKYWYYTSAVPSGSPDNGLTYSATKTGNGLYGTKLNSDGYAWFAKAAVAGTLRVGAYYSSSSSSAYEVDVYACSSTGTKGDKIGSLTTPHVGGVSSTLDIDDDVEGIYIVRNTNSEGVLYFVEFKDATPTCDATAPGDIEKGEASGGTGKIVLKVEDDGEPVSGDAWYWQSSASGEAKTDEYDAEDGKEVSATGTYYLRSYNTAGDCWSTATSVEVTAGDLLTAPTATFSDGAYVVGASALNLSTLWSSNSAGTVTYALKVASDYASVTTGAFSATKAGSYVVTASQAATSTYSAVEKEATITVTWPATGEATILYNVAVGTSNTALGTASTDDNSASISNLSNFTAAGGLTVSGLGDGKASLSTKLQTLSAKDVSKYIYVTFDVASGKEFVLDSVVTYIVAVSNAKTIEVVMNDTEGTKDSLNYSQAKNSEAAKHVFDFTSSAKAYEGTVTLKLYAYGQTDHYRLAQPLKICGTVATKVVKYDLSFAAGTGASGTMSTVKYASGATVTLPACTFTAPSGKVFDAWVVTKDAGGSVTVTSNQFTMPAEAVTATATWKDRPKHTDATLSALTVGGEAVADFDAATTSYNVELPFGTFAAPTVDATANDEYAKPLSITQASSTSGDATVVVTAEDGSTTKTYTVHFSVEESKDIELVWKTSGTRCGGTTTGSTAIKSNDASVSTYINPITFTGGGEEGSSLNVAKKAGNMLTLSAKPGFAIAAMSFYGKIESDDAKLEYSLDGGSSWNDLASTSGDDACYSDVFTSEEVHTLCMRSAGNKGFWIRNMQLTMIQACTSKTIAWTTAPASEYEVGKAGYAIAASANNGTVAYTASNAAITVNESTGALTINSLTNDIDLSASVPAGDGAIYCATGASVIREEIKTYYLVTFDAQNETAVSTVKYYSGGAAIALPSPSYPGYVFQGWFDASTGGTEVTSAITPTASRTVYAQWEEQCAGPTITTQPASAGYFVGSTALALSCAATPGVEGKALTYTWYSCDDTERTNPVALAGAPTPSTAAVGTFYYYCAVTEADCDVVRNSNVATIAVTEKDKVCLIKATLKGGSTAPDVEGYYAGSATASTQSYNSTYDGYKFGSNGHYVGLTLATGKKFKTGDVVNIYVGGVEDDKPATKAYFATAANADNVVATIEQNLNQGNNYINLPAALNNAQAFYLYRVDSKMNPYVKYVEVNRACPAPVLEGITFNGEAAVADELAENTFNVELTNGTNPALATVVPTVMWVGAHATTPYTILTNEGAWAWGENTYRVMDKDGDYTDYTINLTEALPDAEEPVIATDLTDQAYCAGEIPELDATANAVSDGGTLSYQWYDAEGAIEGETNAKYTPAGEGSYYCKVTNTLDAHRPMTTTSATAVLTQKDATSISGETTFDIEQGATVKFQPTITGANATYAWYACDAEGNHEGDALGTKASYTTASLSTVGTFYYVLEVTADCGNDSQIFTVNVSDLGASLVAHRPGNYYGQTLKEYDGRYYEIYGFASSASDKNFLWAGAPTTSSTAENCVLAFNTSGEASWLTNSVNGRGSSYSSITNASQFNNGSCSGYKMNYRSAHSLILKVKGYDQFSIYSSDNSASSGNEKYLEVSIDGVIVKSTANTSWAVHNFDLTDGEHVIVVRGNVNSSSSNNEFSQFSLRLPVVAKVDETEIISVQDAINDATDPITITMLGNSYEDIVIEDGKDVTIAGAGHTLNSITVENGGKVNASSALTLVENLYLEAQAGASGQVLGATNLTANAVYMDVRFFKGAETLDAEKAGRWYMISAPFDVNLNGGFSLPDGTPMTFGTSDGANIFDLFEYDGAKRASTGVTGWKRAQGKMHAGRACLIGFNPGQATTIRLKAAGTTMSEPESITLQAFDGEDANKNWNGVANPTLHYTDLSCDVQTFNNEDGENGRKYIAYSSSSTSFVVGTAFFVQATGTIDLSAASHSEFRAPSRTAADERMEACVRIFREEATDFADQMYIRASETASSEYEQSHDMITWNGTTANTAMIWANNYGKRLAIEEAQLVNDKASYALGLYAPKAGEYRIATMLEDDADIYLTKDGMIIWNLSMNECTLTLDKGNNEGFGLLLVKKAPQVTTGIESTEYGVQSTDIQKVIIDEHVYILRDRQMYDVTGKLVK